MKTAIQLYAILDCDNKKSIAYTCTKGYRKRKSFFIIFH